MLQQPAGDRHHWPSDVRHRGRGSGWPSSGLLLTGLLVVGLGVLAWQYIGPDLRRYMKIESM
jgi:hypothetical protein